jgi:hypothetical protein
MWRIRMIIMLIMKRRNITKEGIKMFYFITIFLLKALPVFCLFEAVYPVGKVCNVYEWPGRELVAPLNLLEIFLHPPLGVVELTAGGGGQGAGGRDRASLLLCVTIQITGTNTVCGFKLAGCEAEAVVPFTVVTISVVIITVVTITVVIITVVTITVVIITVCPD